MIKWLSRVSLSRLRKIINFTKKKWLIFLHKFMRKILRNMPINANKNSNKDQSFYRVIYPIINMNRPILMSRSHSSGK